MGRTVGELSWKNAEFCVFSVAAMAKCLRLVVGGNSVSGRVVRRQRVPVFDEHRLPSTGSRWDKRWVS
jgi:hypothetical protein